MFGMQPPGDGHGQLAKLSDDLQQVESPVFFFGGGLETKRNVIPAVARKSFKGYVNP